MHCIEWAVKDGKTQLSRWLPHFCLKIDRRSGSGGQIVTMMKPTQPWHGDNFAANVRIFSRLTACRGLLAQAEMAGGPGPGDFFKPR
jgi:hypothetical protein